MLVLATIDPSTFALLVAAILGTGGISGLVAYRKTGSESESIAARTLIAVNDELRKELARRDSEIVQLRERVAVLEHAAHIS